jgi:hypothetical protein
MSSSERLDRALTILKEQGHEIGTKGTAAISATSGTLILIDGQHRTEDEVLEMAGWPEVP